MRLRWPRGSRIAWLWMTDGRIVADGTPLETLTEKRLEEVYGVRARVHSKEN